MSEQALDHLIKILSRLPSLGPRSARRVALHMIQSKDTLMRPLAHALEDAANTIRTCTTCGNLDTISPCQICTAVKRDISTLCIVASVADIWAIERAGQYRGQYHVLGGVLSAIDGITPNDLSLHSLSERVRQGNIVEVIIALSATVDGQTTAHYITDLLDSYNIKITGLARGIPTGGELDFLDDSTITTAFKARKDVNS